MVTDRHHRISWICFHKEQIGIQADGWHTIGQYWRFYAEKPEHQQAKDLLDPNNTSRGIWMHVSDPASLGYGQILSQRTPCIKTLVWGRMIHPRWRSHHLGKIQIHILHCVEFYAMHIPPICSWFFSFRLKWAHNLILIMSLCPFPLFKISRSNVLLASKWLRTVQKPCWWCEYLWRTTG